MIVTVSFLVIVAGAFLSLRTTNSREVRFALSAIIPRSAASIYEIISANEMAPVWRRQPCWLPNPLRMSTMIPWGCSFGAGNRGAGSHPRGPEEIRVRHMKNREFSYLSIRPHDLSCASTFRLVPEEGKCRLTWEVHFKVRRWSDIVSQPAIAAAARDSMQESFRMIQHLLLSRPDSIRSRELIFEARRDQAPAA
jgi:hypothetical protein